MPGSANFILFQGRIVNTAHMVSLIPPRPDGGKFVIEARMEGNVSFTEDYEDDEEAAGRYLALASLLLGDLALATGGRRDVSSDDSNDVSSGAEPETVVGDPALDELMRKLRSELAEAEAEAEGIDVR